MTQNSRRTRKGARARGSATPGRRLRYLIGGIAVALALVAMAVYNHQTSSPHHPAPRAEMNHATHLMPAQRYAQYPRVARAYEMVAAAPHVVDGVFCYCMCSEHSGHYSLLDCFFSDHAARCDICLSEATMAFQMSRDGHDLNEIRAEIDHRFQS